MKRSEQKRLRAQLRARMGEQRAGNARDFEAGVRLWHRVDCRVEGGGRSLMVDSAPIRYGGLGQ